MVCGERELGDAMMAFELESENPLENVVKIDALLIQCDGLVNVRGQVPAGSAHRKH